MKLQLGLLRLDGGCPSVDDLSMLLGEFSGKSFETSGEAARDSILMVYRGDRITPEDDSDRQPLEQGQYILTWDGRLDNREDFSICFPLTGIQDVPDAVIVLKAYQMFGESAFQNLIGEFALTLWREKARSLTFVRSACGIRPLYYVLENRKLIWSSQFAHLVRISGVDLTVNDRYLLQYLVTTPNIRETPLAKVHTIPPNRIVRFENGEMKYGPELWDPTRIRPIRFRNDADYEEYCREKVTEAVRVRLRSKYPVFAELSGGFDSSTVVMTAHKILQCPHKLQTVSCIYEESKSADERNFIHAIEEHRGVDTQLIHEKDQRITLGLDDPCFTGVPDTLHCFPGRYELISRLMQDKNARVLLTGRGGDHLFWSAPEGAPLVADELLRLNLKAAHRQCAIWSRAANVPYYPFLATAVLPAALQSIWPSRCFWEHLQIPDWVRKAHRTTLLNTNADFQQFSQWRAAPSRRRQVGVIDRMLRMFGYGFGREYSQIFSHPYSHRPLIEACLAIPMSQSLRDGQTRSLMRRAFQGLLPPKTINRSSKGLVDEAIFRAVRREQAKLSDAMNWEVCRRGYANPTRLGDAFTRARLGFLDPFGPLIRLFAVERWLRSLKRMHAATT
jgi:asparagine synthase (glutamine-hydrolysing)